jgi:hypothetical protein
MGPGPITGPGTSTVTGTGGSGGSAGGAGGGGGAGGSQATNAIALFDSQVPSNQDQQSWLDTGEALTPTTLIVAVSTAGLSCAAPDFRWTPSKSQALVLVGLPEAMQKAGTYAFSSTDVIAWGGYWLGDGMGNGGGGSGVLKQGSVEVVSIGADSVEIRFAGLGTYYDVLNGAHSAIRCP